jgi:hypothetical protein
VISNIATIQSKCAPANIRNFKLFLKRNGLGGAKHRFWAENWAQKLFGVTLHTIGPKCSDMKKDDAKTIASGLNDLSGSYIEVAEAIRATNGAAHGTRKLWRDGNHSVLIKAGLVLIAFPDPTISDVVGGAMVAAGLVQEGIRRRALHVDDLPKTFRKTMRELQNLRSSV